MLIWVKSALGELDILVTRVQNSGVVPSDP